MTPEAFIEKWQDSGLGERQASQSHFNDLCTLLGEQNPLEWIERIPEVVEGFPDRIIAKLGHEADLKKRTLTNLYNARPAWLDNIHKELDAAVAAAYGWDDYTPDMPDDEIIARLFELNQLRAGKPE